MKGETVGDLAWKGKALCELVCRPFIEADSLAHDNAEPALTILHDPKLLLVLRTFDVGLEHDDRLIRLLALAAQPIESSCSLFEHARVPGKIVMNDVSTFQMEVNPFTHHGARNQDFREERCVECEHEAVAQRSRNLT